MTIEITLLIAIISVTITVLSFILSNRRSAKQEDTESAAQLTKIVMQIEKMQDDIHEIKDSMKSLRSDLKAFEKELKTIDRRLTIVEASRNHHHRDTDDEVTG